MKKNKITRLLACTATTALVSQFGLLATAQAQESAETSAEVIQVTGSRIARSELTATSPVASIEKTQLQLDRAVTVEDITVKLPQAAGGANSTGATVGDSLGSSTLDLRGLGQNRTLVLINGTRATPFSFRNSVDLNSIPAGLIKRVDVLTGGAAAIYGADAVAGVVNFIMDDQYEGLELSSSYEMPSGGGEQFNMDAIFGGDINDGRGHVTGYLGYSEREELLAGERDFTSATKTLVASQGGNFTDIASGNFFAFDDAGNFSATRQTTDVTAERFLIQPLKRLSAGVFFNYDLADSVEAYGRAMFTQVRVTGAGSTGQTPVAVNEQVRISADNAFITDQFRDLLTFDANGEALVNVERNLGLGMQHTKTTRNTLQFQVGLRGDITDNIAWDLYGQYGRTDGKATVYNNGVRFDAGGNSRFAAIANSVDIFNPNTDLSSLSSPVVHSDRQREQSIVALTFSGDTLGLFELPAGPLSYAVGYEYRKEHGIQTAGSALRSGTAYGLGGIFDMDAEFDSKEFYAEVLVPVLVDLPFVQELNLEGAYRTSDYSNTDSANTNKLGLSWTINDDVRLRATRQTAIRAPNLGEFAGPETALSLALFDPNSSQFVPRLGGRFDGDPCLDGRGNAEQCARFGAAAPGTAFDTSQAIYTFGGNPNIRPEEAETYTVGLVYTPDYIDGFDLTLDYYDIEISDAVSQIQPIAALTNCYIDNPVADNPLCGAVLRDPNTGLISQTLVNDLNLATLKQAGIDIGARYRFDSVLGFGETLQISYQGNVVTEQKRQDNATVAARDCKGTFGTACTGDFASILQADYRHRAAIDLFIDEVNVQLSWRRIGDVVNALDATDTISAQNYIDLAASWEVSDELQLTFGVDNLFDKEPPMPKGAANLFGTVSDYDVIGRSFGLSVRYRP
ncbi:TonB-dependent receptor domain-containing protein [Bowmanella pacifica]|uniref:TonB-dependent receptor n=1 Tax=Bowmanella pacifica TaxID=502051 RepID=A0A918DG01_9ALTE|nr:TonB-dependent receptor [Bowmanella pacifica]GGO64850.1 TonB-dependent receptor [Bowmanella pacifica]